MSHRLSRKEIKRDEFREAIGRTVEYASSHRRLIAQVAAGIVLVALLAAGVLLYFHQRGGKAAQALNRALEVYQAEISADSPQPEADPPTFADEAARRARAKEEFQALVESFGGTDAGSVARAYLGRIAAEEGDAEQAREHWRRSLDRWDDAMLAAEVHLNLLRLDLAEGKEEEVVGELEAMLNRTDKPMPEDVILYELASVRERLGHTDEALSAYQRIIDEFPGSPYSQQARQKAQALTAEQASS